MSTFRAGMVVLLAVGAGLFFVRSSSAQNARAIPAPDGVVLTLSTEGDRHQFHLGELIPVSYSYTATPEGRYIYVSQPRKLAGGRELEFSCTPAVEPATHPSRVDDSYLRFQQMLMGPCVGAGVGGGIGGGCGDCDWERPLSSTPMSFGSLPLNMYRHFRAPGVYKCRASSAQITTAPKEEPIRSALRVNSNEIALAIVDDPGWARSAAVAYADAYDKRCRGDDVTETRFLECSDIARRITYLDTIDSLTAEVRFFDGKTRGWNNGFWDAIVTTPDRDEALSLMTKRIQDHDVQVSTSLLETLAIWGLKVESPDAFRGADPADYHLQAVEQLRKYVRLLGSSLSKKNADVSQECVKTYRALAEGKDCDRNPLIPDEERDAVLAGAIKFQSWSQR